jgi:hypothetical protein
MALSISAKLAGRIAGPAIPRNEVTGSFGKSTTLPSGCMKNFTRSPGLSPRCSRIAFGIVAWPLLVMADSIIGITIVIM